MTTGINDILEKITERYAGKYPDLPERLERGAAKAEVAKEYFRQGVIARMSGELVQARHLRELGDNQWQNILNDEPLSVPSQTHMGQESSCPRCRDVGWLERSPEELIPCPNCSPYDMEAVRLQHSGIPEARRLQTIGAFKPGTHPKAKLALDAANNFLGATGMPILTLSGPPGCGKTHLARGIALRMIRDGWVAKYWSTAHMTSVMHSTQGPFATRSLKDFIEENINEPLLILDDFGVETLTPWVISQYEWLIDKRWDAMGATLLTTNLPESEIRTISLRIHSRLMDNETSVWGDMMGVPDYRRQR